MTTTQRFSRVLSTAAFAAAGIVAAAPAAAEPGCRAGGVAAAKAYVLFNPIYAMYFGSFEDYVAQNRVHLRAGSNAVRCIAALSRAYLSNAVQLYDPVDMQRRQQIDEQLRRIGINPGPQQQSVSSMLLNMSMQFSWLSRGLPAAADGDYGPFNTPANDFEQMHLLARTLFQQFIQDPTIRQSIAAAEPLIREAAQLEYRMITHAAARLANAQ